MPISPSTRRLISIECLIRRTLIVKRSVQSDARLARGIGPCQAASSVEVLRMQCALRNFPELSARYSLRHLAVSLIVLKKPGVITAESSVKPRRRRA